MNSRLIKKSGDVWLGVLLWLNALPFLGGSLAGWSFDQWIIVDVVAVIIFAFIGFFKGIRILLLIAAVIIVGMFLRFSTPLWLLIDLFIIASCLYVGYLLFKEQLHRVRETGSPAHDS